MELPATTQRLFSSLVSEVGGTPVFSSETAGTLEERWVIERLLEDGDRADLCWLFREVGRDAVVEWFAHRGERRLSDRSRTFWALVLGCSAPARNTKGTDLWPL